MTAARQTLRRLYPPLPNQVFGFAFYHPLQLGVTVGFKKVETRAASLGFTKVKPERVR